jgi:hypothetical protein
VSPMQMAIPGTPVKSADECHSVSPFEQVEGIYCNHRVRCAGANLVIAG